MALSFVALEGLLPKLSGVIRDHASFFVAFPRRHFRNAVRGELITPRYGVLRLAMESDNDGCAASLARSRSR